MLILVASTQWPYYGGSATLAYKTISYLRKQGHEVVGMFFNVKKFTDVDPDNIGDVYKVKLYEDHYNIILNNKPKEILESVLQFKHLFFTFEKVINWIKEFNERIKTHAKKVKQLPLSFSKIVRENSLNRTTAWNWLSNRKKEFENSKSFEGSKKRRSVITCRLNSLPEKSFRVYQDDIYTYKLTDICFTPDLILAYNYSAPIFCKEIFPHTPLTYLSVGSPEITLGPESPISNKISAVEFIKKYNKNFKELKAYHEIKKCCNISDNVIIQSKIMMDILLKIHPEMGKSKKLHLFDTHLECFMTKNKTYNKSAKDKDIDLIFVASNLQRTVKNTNFCLKIFKKFSKLNKVIIGGYGENSNEFKDNKHPDFIGIPNTEVLPLCDNKKVNQYLSRSKVLLLPSYYESFSIVAIEAINNGCRVLTSYNTGISMLLKEHNICSDVYYIHEWINKIRYLLDKFDKIKKITIENHSNLFNYCKNIKSHKIELIDANAIGIYKIPSIWNTDKNLNKYTHKMPIFKTINEKDLESINEHSSRMTNIKKNVYLELFIKLVNHKNMTNAHFIFVDETIDCCLNFNFNGITIWILKDKQDVLYFNYAKFYFLRGNYHNFYNTLIPKDASTIFYPATSFKYEYNIKLHKSIEKKNLIREYKNNQNIPDKYDIVLVHENDTYKDVFNKSKLIKFNKFASSDYGYLHLKRIYDFIFVADATQRTKNHNLMYAFMNYCERNNMKFNFIYVSSKELLKERVQEFKDDYQNINVEYYSNLKPKELNRLFNQTMINLLFSGRDACPRTISESLAAGCYNVALDTLSDGKSYYNVSFGELVGNDSLKVQLRKSGSLSYVDDNQLWKTIIEIHDKDINHELISVESKKQYNIGKIMKKLN